MVDEIVEMVMNVKPITDWYVYKKELVITFEEELYLYELEVLNHQLLTITGSIVENIFHPLEDSDYNKIVLKL